MEKIGHRQGQSQVLYSPWCKEGTFLPRKGHDTEQGNVAVGQTGLYIIPSLNNSIGLHSPRPFSNHWGTQAWPVWASHFSSLAPPATCSHFPSKSPWAELNTLPPPFRSVFRELWSWGAGLGWEATSLFPKVEGKEVILVAPVKGPNFQA